MSVKFSLPAAVAFVAGLAALLAPDLWADGAGREPLFVLGALLALVGAFGLLGKAGPSEWTATAFAVLLFVAPWAWQFTGSDAAAWTAWIAGAVTVIVGLYDSATAGDAAD
ncbi:SPW repeat protein [Actinocorallia sp. API 0066]|uniref:SPW repeat domain-containing protein n=1 Tax=Actinocorallia sp. API 0066 TaxID=2896846 RepID=UPI001E48DE43|nr:SPW repeat protein [Actinocorallia sp. API 0066]MCD0453661.1 SPW repeat protein [Actinocorallia sp. API 0066]